MFAPAAGTERRGEEQRLLDKPIPSAADAADTAVAAAYTPLIGMMVLAFVASVIIFVSSVVLFSNTDTVNRQITDMEQAHGLGLFESIQSSLDAKKQQLANSLGFLGLDAMLAGASLTALQASSGVSTALATLQLTAVSLYRFTFGTL